MIDPRIRDYNRRVAMPAIERLRKDGRYVDVPFFNDRSEP